uniref:GYF domain-containing protein n=1 Tax=Panagrolaimus superbus TaxID=310955 RepID=A0A914YU87_9BILA
MPAVQWPRRPAPGALARLGVFQRRGAAAMTQWYFHASAQADRVGPLDDEAARRYAQANPRALAWCQGMARWTPTAEVAELRATGAGLPTPPPVPSNTAGNRADDIEFRIRRP